MVAGGTEGHVTGNPQGPQAQEEARLSCDRTLGSAMAVPMTVLWLVATCGHP